MPATEMHPASEANFSAFTYSEIHNSNATATSVTVDDKSITIAGGATIHLLFNSISSTAGIFVLGNVRFTPRTEWDVRNGNVL